MGHEGLGPAPPDPEGLARGGRGATILVVEDEPDLVWLLRFNLESEGYRTFVARNGEAALELLRREHPDLMLLDLMMPVMDGWQFREAQLHDPEISNIPVVVLSAVKDEKVPAERHFSKPCDLDELLDTVWEFTGGP
jgi:CheY-like chemotaxis protein